MKKIPSIKLPIIKNGDSSNHILSDITKNKKIIIFGVPGAFTPTCSEKHLPGFINLYNHNLSVFNNPCHQCKDDALETPADTTNNQIK